MAETRRRMDVSIEIDLWDWPAGSKKSTIDATKDFITYRFQKTIKNPEGTCQLTVVPQRASTHILDILSTLDVVRIYEFGKLKFLGYIQRIGYTGQIDPQTGMPHRDAIVTCKQFGSLLYSASIGLGLGTALGNPEDQLFGAATKLSKDIADAVVDGTSYAELVGVVVDSFKSYLTSIGASNFLTYLDEYLDISTGLTSKESPLIPRTYELFTGTEQTLTFWQVVDQLVQRPFNEFWIDNGPRKVSIDGSDVTLPSKACLVFRPVPFNGTVVGGGSPGNAFDSLPEIVIDKDHLTRFDLSRGMDEVFTFFAVKEPAFSPSDLERLLLGQAVVDTDRLGKYLFKPFITELFYTRVESADGSSVETTKADSEAAAKDGATTLYNWFNLNEDFLSGVITMMVPSDNDKDPKIGQKVSVSGIEGFFYVEGIAHTWRYGGALMSNLTVTRGYNRTKKILLKDRLFTRNRI